MQWFHQKSKQAQFLHADFRDTFKQAQKGDVIYCDPPYKNTEGYSTGDFDHDLFWETMRKWSKHNCVFISEESAPSDFIVVWKKSKRRTLDKTSRFHKYEKIYKSYN